MKQGIFFRSFCSFAVLCLTTVTSPAFADLPDLNLSSSDIIFSNNTPEPTQVITITATIRNDGPFPINTTPVTAHETQEGTNTGGTSITTDSWKAQAFTVDHDMYLGRVDLRIKHAIASTDTIRVRIATNNINRPSSTILASKTLSSDITDYYWQAFEFDDAPWLTAGTYWICMENLVTSSSYYVFVDVGVSSFSVTANQGLSWSAPQAYSAFYRVYECTSVAVSCYYGDPDDGSSPIGSSVVTTPFANGDTTTVNWQWTAVAGSTDIYVTADHPSPGAIEESDEGNNISSRTISVVATSPSLSGAVHPLEGAADVPVTDTVRLTFSEDMNVAKTTSAITVRAIRDAYGIVIDSPVAGTISYANRELTFDSLWKKGHVYEVTISTGAGDLYGNALAEKTTWTFSTVPPPAILGQVFPLENALNIGPTEQIKISFTDDMDVAKTTGAISVRAIRDKDGGVIDLPVIGTATYSTRLLTFSNIWSKGFKYEVTLSTNAADTYGNPVLAEKTWEFTVTSSLSIVGQVSPPENGTSVGGGDPVVIVFNDLMNSTATLQALSVRATQDASGAAIDEPSDGTKAYYGTTLTFNAVWKKGYTYRVTLTTDAQDLYGNTLPGDKTWTFTVVPPPAVVGSVSPVENTMNAGPSDVVRVTFVSDDMDPALVTQALSVRAIRDNAGNAMDTPVPGSASYSAGTLTFSAPWQKGYAYRVTLSTGARDVFGNAIGSAKSWEFAVAMDHGIENTVTDGASLTKVICEPNIIEGDYFITIDTNPAALSYFAARISRANEKMRKTIGSFAAPLSDSYRRFSLYKADGSEYSGGLSGGARIVVSYAEERPGFVRDSGGTLVKEKTLALYRLDEASELWLKVPGAQINDAGNTVAARVGHFSLYALLGASDTDLSNAYAYPVPWKPNSGKPGFGTLAGGITFANLGSEATIRIYTLSGELVRALHYSYAGGNEQMVWDGTNSGNSPVASGVYLYYIDNGKEHKTGKLIIVK